MKKSLLILCLIIVPLMLIASSTAVEISMEESGEESITSHSPVTEKSPITRSPVLLIPNSTDDYVGMFDPVDGTYLGVFIIEDTAGALYNFSTPINAVQGPFGYIFVSDQVTDAVYGFDSLGNFLYVVADTTYLNNVRGIDFRNDTLFVTSGDDYVAMFDGPMSFVGNFIQDGTDPFDILFLEDSTCLYCDIQGSTDNVRQYDKDGANPNVIFNISFPEQVQYDIAYPGHFLNAAFSDDQITEFLIDGTIVNTWTWNSPRGVFRLGNGNILVTDGIGVHELDSATGALVETEDSGSYRFIELVDLPLGVSEQPETNNPPRFLQLSPNPFTDYLQINYTLTSSAETRLSIYSVTGAKITSIDFGTVDPGTYTYIWNGEDDYGNEVESGVYFVKISMGEFVYQQKVNFLK
ncbi:MAG: hypothetical protein APR63_13210 [Desulfuromonas sp. SDB]|nr:MAG: hypothetical protein APR63_13210 [Desulfuromonas sp. SDB]